jgi:hypothetical protein
MQGTGPMSAVFVDLTSNHLPAEIRSDVLQRPDHDRG